MQSITQEQNSGLLQQTRRNPLSDPNSQNEYLSALINDLPELGKYMSSSLPNSTEDRQEQANSNSQNESNDNEGAKDQDSQTQYEDLSPRYKRLLLVTQRAIEEVLNRITIEKVLPCYPTLAKTPLGIYALTQATLQICKYFSDSCNFEFDQVYRERNIGKQLYSLEQLIREAQERKRKYENRIEDTQETSVEKSNERDGSSLKDDASANSNSSTTSSDGIGTLEQPEKTNAAAKTHDSSDSSNQNIITEQTSSTSNKQPFQDKISDSLSAAIRASDLTPSSIVAATVYPSQKKTLELLNAKLSELTTQNKERMAKFENVHNEIVDRLAHIDDGISRLKARITDPVLMTEQLIKKRQAKFLEDYGRLDKQKQLKSVSVKHEEEN